MTDDQRLYTRVHNLAKFAALTSAANLLATKHAKIVAQRATLETLLTKKAAQ